VSVLAIFMTSLLIPLLTSTSDAFTGRGRLWVTARDYWVGHPWFGGGFDAWSRTTHNTSLGYVGDYSPHSLWLDLGVATGVAGLLLFCLMVFFLWRRRATGGEYVLGVVVATILAVGTLEQPLTVKGIGTFTFALFGLLLTTPQLQESMLRLPEVHRDRLASIHQ